MKAIVCFAFVCCMNITSVYAQTLQSQTQDAKHDGTQDITAENAFTKNCEGPSVDTRGRLFVVNAGRDGTIGLVAADGTVSVFATLPSGSIGNSTCFGTLKRTRGTMYIADFAAHNILQLDTATRRVSVYAHSENFNQPNDMCINRNGQIFASDPDWKGSTGNLWRIDPAISNTSSSTSGSATLLESGMGTTNGIALSPDERTLYVNESIQRKIWAYSVDSKGNLHRKRLFTSFGDFGLDGMKCDARGNLFVTRYGKGVIAVFSPKGALVREIALKGKDCSNCTFASGGRMLYVTMQDRKCVEMVRLR
jgi:gluconolactonase